MTDFLAAILAQKAREVDALRAAGPLPARTADAPRGFARAIAGAKDLAVIAEVKQASPSKGLIQPSFHPVATAQAYEAAGASCISVLTDQHFFRGDIAHLRAVREAVSLPVLRKDFIVDECQIDEAFSQGADAVLLICAALSPSRLRALSRYAQDLGLDVLVEVHREDELAAAVEAHPSVIGVNNRDLTTFEVRLDTAERLIPLVPKDIPAIAESGVHTPQDAARMAACGARGILVGESLMRPADHAGRRALLQALRVSVPVPEADR
ncbi:MAG: indole-3-glycerol phosphate synthase TrpC [Alicyclobacillus sp.]|nr:indole-3-glycerol phosphate synthase TrpC [Alicyclobacillus sp.]